VQDLCVYIAKIEMRRVFPHAAGMAMPPDSAADSKIVLVWKGMI